MKEKTIGARLDEIEPKITNPTFRENAGLGNEIGYYIFDYDSKDEYVVRDYIQRIKHKINEVDIKDFKIKEFDILFGFELLFFLRLNHGDGLVSLIMRHSLNGCKFLHH